MTDPGQNSEHMIITVETATGKVVKIVDENGRDATPLATQDFDEISLSKGGFQHVGVILHAHSSPG